MPRYDLIEPSYIRGLAETLGYGAEVYEENNWKKGVNDYKYVRDTWNHLVEHLNKFLEGDRSEPHLDHAKANLMFIEFFHGKHPEFFGQH